MTKTADILAAMSAKLTAAGLPVREDTENPFSFEDLPVIVLVAGSELPQAASAVGYLRWDLQVTLCIAAEATTASPNPTLAPEPTRSAAHLALYADRTLGGVALDIVAGSVNRHIDPENPALGVAEATYTITYRQLEGQV